MRDSFSGFYGVSETTIGEVFKADNTVFIFDTNILLTLYRCEEETRNQFLNIWKKVKDQCWFPHHVCLEYQRNRLNVIRTSRDSLNAIPEKIKKTVNQLRKDFEGQPYNQTISRYSKLNEEIRSLLEKIDSAAQYFETESIKSRKDKINFILSHDIIRDEIDSLTAGRIGPPPQDQEHINELNKAGKERYKYKIGPGYEDSSSKSKDVYSFNTINYESEYGDYYVWSQILDYVGLNPDKNIVYVTNDNKPDFFYKVDRSIRGPNESLTSEIKRKGAKEFVLHNIDNFLHHANMHLNAEINEETIAEFSNAGTLVKRKRKSAITLNFKPVIDKVSLSTKEIENLSDSELNTLYVDLHDRLESRQAELDHLPGLILPKLKDDSEEFLSIKSQWVQNIENLIYNIRRIERVASNRASMKFDDSNSEDININDEDNYM